MNILQIKSGLNLFNVLNKFKPDFISIEDENSNFFDFKEAHQKLKFKLDTKKSLLILGLFFAFFSNPLKAQTFFFTPGWGSAPCSVNFKVFNSSGTLLLSGDSNSIKFPIRNPPTQINCFSGIPDYVEYTVSGYLFNPIVVPINNSVAVSLPCLGGAFYNFTAYFTPSGLGCPQETLILNY
jgi:hypothetical protein